MASVYSKMVLIKDIYLPWMKINWLQAEENAWKVSFVWFFGFFFFSAAIKDFANYNSSLNNKYSHSHCSFYIDVYAFYTFSLHYTMKKEKE